MAVLIRKDIFWGVIATLCGVLMGVVWLVPFYSSPETGHNAYLPPALRALRMFTPVIVGTIALFSAGGFKLKWKNISALGLVLMSSTFVLFPAVAVIKARMNESEIAFGFLPLALSFFSALIVMVTPAKFWRQVMIGIGLLSLGLISLRLYNHGFELSTFYFRPRAHLGFNHPLVTSAAILSCLWCIYLVPPWSNARYVHAIFLLCALVVAGVGLMYADSRNSLLFLVAWALGSLFWVISKSFSPLLWKAVVFCTWLLVPAAISFLAWQWRPQASTDFIAANNVASGRLFAAGQLIDLFISRSFSLVGPSWVEIDPNGFAVADSVFLSYWGHFGFVSIVLLLVFWLWLGIRLRGARFHSSLDYIGAGAWFGLTGYFLFDGQGLTVSNLALFLPLTWLLRMCIIRPSDQSVSSTSNKKSVGALI